MPGRYSSARTRPKVPAIMPRVQSYLPTSGYARAYSGVNLDSFIRKITFQEITRDGLLRLGPVIEVMAANEGLDAHKNAVSVRLDKEIK